MKQIERKITSYILTEKIVRFVAMIKILRYFPGVIGFTGGWIMAAYGSHVYPWKVNSSTITILAIVAAQRTRARAPARTCAISVASSRHSRARGIFPRDERTTSVAKRKTRAALGKKMYGQLCFQGRRRGGKVGASERESYEWTSGDEENWNAGGRR